MVQMEWEDLTPHWNVPILGPKAPLADLLRCLLTSPSISSLQSRLKGLKRDLRQVQKQGRVLKHDAGVQVSLRFKGEACLPVSWSIAVRGRRPIGQLRHCCDSSHSLGSSVTTPLARRKAEGQRETPLRLPQSPADCRGRSAYILPSECDFPTLSLLAATSVSE
jgi:hypothetical protein